MPKNSIDDKLKQLSKASQRVNDATKETASVTAEALIMAIEAKDAGAMLSLVGATQGVTLSANELLLEVQKQLAG